MFHRFELSRRMGEWQKPYAQRHLPGGDRSWWKSSSSSWPGGAGKICQGFIQPRYRASEVFGFVMSAGAHRFARLRRILRLTRVFLVLTYSSVLLDCKTKPSGGTNAGAL